jgi:L-seryl-tRNA(Ser) seleniumtransferase
MNISELLRSIPSVSALLTAAESSALRERFGDLAATDALRHVLKDARTAIKDGKAAAPSETEIVLRAYALLDGRNQSKLRPVFNMTGVVLHTNLGRAILAEAAIEAAVSAMRDAVALEFDLRS